VDHNQARGGQASPAHHHDVVLAHEHDHEHNSNGKKPCDENFCCLTMQALLPTAKAIIIANPLSQQLVAGCLLNAASEQTLGASNCEFIRQANPRERVFAPVVCLDAAHRSLAPPSTSPAVG